MAKQLNVNLAFNADTGQAKSQIQELQSLLNKITYAGSTSSITGTAQKDLQAASAAAKELQFHLNNAFNTTTGKFDLSLLDRSLKTSGSNISNLSTQLLEAGATGQQAFLKLAQSISMADQPMLRISNRMREFGTVMKNTIKWQLSSSMIHGFMGALQSAYGYAQDLNKSLTDIRIVTGYSADQMAQFAEQANKAAKSLSTTTTDYANASLIYFQQGLSNSEVEERTQVTIKMANAAGQSAQIVSEQMTAVWNNFDDGSKSLEYYADVMAALGAATATSTDEIAQGLSKFAAVADTVGLSYEYATAALATITSNTRESADVVGNALKTLFARIQGLQLGETLEDGTDLNKYSQALEKVGISIYEQNGELKAMDKILNEMGSKWTTLGEAQQVALAQTVAGVRQYTQLIALMDNWDVGDSDSFMSNLSTAQNAEGTLTEQAAIYEESWEAAAKRVRASAEGIYQSLLDDKFFIKFNNGLANVLNGVDAFIDGLGGVKPLIAGIASIFMTNFAHKIPQALEDLRYNLQLLSPKGSQKAYENIQTQMTQATDEAFTKYGVNKDSSTGFAIDQANKLTAARTKLALVNDRMSASERQAAETQLGLIQGYQEEITVLKQKNEAMQQSIDLKLQSLNNADARDEIFNNPQNAEIADQNDFSQLGITGPIDEVIGDLNRRINSELVTNLQNANNEMKSFADGATTSFNLLSGDATQFSTAMAEIGGKIQNINAADVGPVRTQLLSFINLLPQGITQSEGLKKAIEELKNADSPEKLKKAFTTLNEKLQNVTLTTGQFRQTMKDINPNGGNIGQIAEGMNNINQQAGQAGEKVKLLENMLKEFQPTHVVRISEAFGALGGMMGSVVTVGRSVVSIFNALSNPDLSGWEKVSAVLTSLSMIIPSTTATLRSLGIIYTFVAGQSQKLVASLTAEQAARISVNTSGAASVAVSNMVAMGKLKEIAATQGNITAMTAEVLAEKAGITVKQADTIISKMKAGATLTQAAAEAGLTASLWAQVAAWIATWTAMSPILVIILAISAAVVILGGIIWAIVKAFQAWKASTPEAQLEAAKEATEGMTAAAEAANDAYEDLLNTINGYESAVASLEDMERGTQEFTNALINANEKAWELISAYNLIQGQDWDYNPETGAIEFTEGTLDNIQYTQQENLENMNIGVGAARINEAQKEVDLAKSNIAPYLQEDLSKIYTALGLDSTGRFESLMQEFTEAANNFDDAKMDEIATEVGKRYYGEDFDFATADSEQLSRIYEMLWSGAEFQQVQQAEQKLDNVTQTETQRAISNSLINEEAFQDTSWKKPILDSLTEDYDDVKATADATWAEKTAEDVSAAFDKYLSDNGLTKDDEGKVFDKDGNEITDLSSLDDAGMRNILATADAISQLEASGISMAEGFNQAASTMSEDEKAIADALVNNNISALTEEQIESLKAMGDIELSDLFDSETLRMIEQNPVLKEALMGWLNDFETQITDWEPPPFNIETWKEDFASKMDIINNLETGDSISAEDYALLGEEYQQYFQVQADGTAILIAKAEELQATAKSIETQELKDDITAKQNLINDTVWAVTEGTNGYVDDVDQIDYSAELWDNALSKGLTEDEAAQRLNSRTGLAMQEALGDELNLDQYTTDVEKLEALTNGWQDLRSSMSDSQATLASTATSMDDLNEMLSDGLITQEQYNEAIDGTVMKEALEEGFDPDSVIDFGEALEEVIDDFEGADKVAKKLALENKKLNKGIQTLADNWDEWGEALKDSTNPKYYEALTGMQDAMEDMFGIKPDASFIEENLDMIQRLAQGDITVLDDLQKAMAKDYITDIVINDEEAQAKMDGILAQIMAMDLENIEIGASIADAPFYDALNMMLTQGQLTADQVNDILSTIGYNPEIEMVTLPFDAAEYTAASNGYTYQYTDPITQESQTIHVTNDQYNQATSGTTVQVPRINASKTVFKGSSGGGGVQKPSGGNKGGGGGGGKSKNPEKKNDSDKSRYHTLQNQLEDLKSEYDEVGKAKDRAFGLDKLNAIDDEIEKTDELIDKQEEYIKAISKDLPKDKAIMDAYYKDVIGGKIKYDERGNIANYDEIQDAMYKKYNDMAGKYTEDSEEWQAFEQQYEQLEKYIEQYEETYDLLRDEEAAYQELLNQRLDLELEKIQYAIELKLNVAEDGLAVLEYQMSRIEDDAFRAAEAISLFSEQAELLYDQMAADREGLNDILGQQLSKTEIQAFYNGDMSVLEGKTFTESQIEAIKEYRDNLLDLNSKFDEIRESIEGKVMETFDAWNEKLESGMTTLDHYGNVLSNYKNIIDIVGKDTLGLSNQFMSDLEDASVDNAIDKVAATKDAYDSMLAAQKDAEEALEKARANGDEASIKMWEDTLASITENAQSAQEDLLSTWADALSQIAEAFESTIARVVETFNKSIYALGGLEGLADDFSRQQENADIMLDDYQKIYELSKLSRDINKTIDDTDNLAGKQKLKKLLGEINKLQEDGVEMSQYDLEYLQATYDLRLAELELEEAQNAKNTVRMSKDNEGNWSYVYTQNTDAVDAAQQKYEDALYAMQDLSSNYIDEMSEKLISTSQEMEEALANIRIQDFASIDDYYAEVERVQKQYQDELKMQEEELQKAIDNNKVLYDEDWTNYHNATGYKISDTESFVTSFKDSMLGTLMDSESDTANFTDIIGSAVDSLTTGLMEGATEYYARLDEAMNAAGTSTGDFAEDTAANIDAVVEKSKEGAVAVDQMAQEMQDAFGAITDSVSEWQETYGLAMQNIIDSNLEVIDSFNAMLEALSIDADKITVSYDINTAPEKDNPAAFDTGGYTGEWGDIGKLAVLHEKELILNQDDTSNLFKTISLSKAILETIDLNARHASMGVGQMTATVIKDDNNQTLEQMVHITAEFPGVNDHNEVETAIYNLINTASQYANRK